MEDIPLIKRAVLEGRFKELWAAHGRQQLVVLVDIRGTRYAVKLLSARLLADDPFIHGQALQEERLHLAIPGHSCIMALLAVEDLGGGDKMLVYPFAGPAIIAILPRLLRLGEEERGRAVEGLLGGVVAGLRHLHDNGIVHRDIKPSNMVYDEAQGTGALIDLGIAVYASQCGVMHCYGEANQDDQDDFYVARTPGYVPPELMAAGNDAEAARAVTGPETDTWAFGVSLAEMLTGRVPDGHLLPVLPHGVSNTLKMIIHMCLHPVAACRPSMAMLDAMLQQSQPCTPQELAALLREPDSLCPSAAVLSHPPGLGYTRKDDDVAVQEKHHQQQQQQKKKDVPPSGAHLLPQYLLDEFGYDVPVLSAFWPVQSAGDSTRSAPTTMGCSSSSNSGDDGSSSSAITDDGMSSSSSATGGGCSSSSTLHTRDSSRSGTLDTRDSSRSGSSGRSAVSSSGMSSRAGNIAAAERSGLDGVEQQEQQGDQRHDSALQDGQDGQQEQQAQQEPDASQVDGSVARGGGAEDGVVEEDGGVVAEDGAVAERGVVAEGGKQPREERARGARRAVWRRVLACAAAGAAAVMLGHGRRR